MGDPVNTAARMLGPAADREVVAVDDLTSATRAVFATEALPPLQVKGKSEPITAFRVTGVTTEVRAGHGDGPLVGRDAEVAAIDQAVVAGRGIVELVGSAGMGKTRLMALVETRARLAGLPIYRCGSDPYATTKPYGVLSAVLEQLLDIDPAGDPVRRGGQLRRRLAALAANRQAADGADVVDSVGSAEHIEALAIPLGAEVPQSGALDGLDVGFRREVVHRSVVDVIAASHPDGLTLIVEDLHWVDDASGDALKYLAAHIDELPLVLFATRRNEGSFAFDPELELVASIELAPLGDEAIKEIANRASKRPLSDYQLDSLVARVSGNPLFASEMAAAMSADESGEIPDSVESVIAGRLDRASPGARQALRILSVWGDEFKLETVEPLMRELGTDTDVRTADLDGLLEEREPGVWGFTQTLHREVAYQGLPYKRRREYHRLIGGHLEAQASDPLSIAGILSVHYDRGGKHDRAWLYCREAGEQASKQLAQVEAVDAFRRALSAGRYVDVPNAELADTAIKLGDAAEHAGHYETARWAYKKARRLVPPQDRAYLVTYRKLGEIDEREGRYAKAQRWYRRGMEAALSVSPKPDRGEWLLLTIAMGGAEFRRGRTKATWELLKPLAEDSRAPAEVRLRAAYLLQLSGTYLNYPEAARYGELGLELVDLVRQPVLHGNLVNNLGIAQYFQGRWDAAADLYEESYHLRDGAGDVLGAVMALNNLGEIRSDQLRFDEARSYFDDGLRRGRAANTTLLIHVLEANRGRLATRLGDFDEAERFLQTALDGFAGMDSASFVADTEARLAELARARGDWADAEARAARLLLEAAKREAGASETVPLIRVRAAAAAATGDEGAAVELLREATATATEAGIRYQRAMSLLELSAFEPDAEHRTTAIELFNALGVNLDQALVTR